MHGLHNNYASFTDNYNLGGAMNKGQSGVLLRGQRRRMNIYPLVLCVLVPCSLFSTVFWSMSSILHFEQPMINNAVVAAGLSVVLTAAAFAYHSAKAKVQKDVERQPNWYMFLFLSCALAWLLAVILGDLNYSLVMQPYMALTNLGTYPSIDVTKMRGQQIMDAGRILFSEGTHLDIKKSMGFRNQRLYCVAPIALGNSTLANYDFWAVGTDCCSGLQADFHCKDFSTRLARGGLRLMNDDDRAYYRLAVQQAEATHKIKATHPLFFTWVQDPMESSEQWRQDGMHNVIMGVFGHFILQLFLVFSAAVAFSKIGYY